MDQNSKKLLTFFLLAFATTLESAVVDNTPTLAWVDCPSDASGADACMSISYKDPPGSNIIVLTKEEGCDTVFHGHLLNVPKSTVAVSGGNRQSLSGMIYISMNSETRPESLRLSYDSATGITSKVLNPSGLMTRERVLEDRAYMDFVATKNRRDLNHTKRALDPNGYKLRVFVGYDDTFHNRFGGSNANVMITGIFSHVNTIFHYPSLGTKLEIEVVTKKYFNGSTWTAQDSLTEVRALANVESTNANVFIFLCNDALGSPHTSGNFATLCSDEKGNRASVTEYVTNTVITAEVVAHEIGHIIGMKYDVSENNGLRTASTGENCTDIGGIMDLDLGADKWSKCSFEDFTMYHDEVGASNFCLEKLPAECEDKTLSCYIYKLINKACSYGNVKRRCPKTCGVCT